jgi:hypothetical protein
MTYITRYERQRARQDPSGFFLRNGFFESVDAQVLYAMIRHLKPKRVVEIGSGMSTLLIKTALDKNEGDGRPGHLHSIDPYPRPFILRRAARQQLSLEVVEIQAKPVDFLSDLEPNDVLFIDSSHGVSIGSDVCHDILELLPRLPEGVYAHIHDIFLPRHYPKEWLTRNHWFWSEQYMFQAFLMFNQRFTVQVALSYLDTRYREAMTTLFPRFRADENGPPSSFWVRVAVEHG